ncbi:MAG: gliding motility-associated ABC transporter substrate-binding protein GldG [Cytophagaceae bacterium]|jgi:ABC-2 type transport system permease protein|nr:gliding motility-associated ABC transporter substrate-binding protein GldG [Cytophagaceae bacterium]
MKNKTRNRAILHLLVLLAAIIVINIISAHRFFRLDLTAEKRYTLAPVTKRLLKGIDDEIFVRVFLTGNLNVGFERLSKATLEMLDEFRYAGALIRYETVDPADYPAEADSLKATGLAPVPVFEAAADGRKTQSMVYPYATVAMRGYEIPVNLLENMQGLSGAENLNISAEALEFKITDAIRKLATDNAPAIAFIEGHGELDEWDVLDVTDALSAYYRVDRGSLTNDPFLLDAYRAVIIAKPQHTFSTRDKFILDQYIMRGGSVLWLIDGTGASLDSLRSAVHTIGLATDVNLADQLFRYGVRINHTLLQDMQCALIQVNAAPVGNSPQFVSVPWLFSPLLSTALNHPATRYVNAVRSEFAGSIDTVGEIPNVTRNILLSTGRYSRELPTPVYISLSQINEQPVREEFRKQYIPVAMSLEGVFRSAFANRPVPPGVSIEPSKVRLQSVPAKMIVVADGDIIRNEVRLKRSASPRILPLGYDEASGQTFGNRQFILNAVNYLTDDEGWMSLRGRNYRLRLLDKEKLARELPFLKVANIVIPLALLAIAGIIIPLVRMRRYVRKD